MPGLPIHGFPNAALQSVTKSGEALPIAANSPKISRPSLRQIETRRTPARLYPWARQASMRFTTSFFTSISTDIRSLSGVL